MDLAWFPHGLNYEFLSEPEVREPAVSLSSSFDVQSLEIAGSHKCIPSNRALKTTGVPCSLKPLVLEATSFL